MIDLYFFSFRIRTERTAWATQWPLSCDVIGDENDEEVSSMQRSTWWMSERWERKVPQSRKTANSYNRSRRMDTHRAEIELENKKLRSQIDEFQVETLWFFHRSDPPFSRNCGIFEDEFKAWLTKMSRCDWNFDEVSKSVLQEYNRMHCSPLTMILSAKCKRERLNC